MRNNWTKITLGEVATLQRGFDLPHQERQPGNVPIISSGGRSGLHSHASAKAPGVVMGRYGTIGELHFVEEDYWPLNTTLWVKEFHGNDERYVYYLLSSLDYDSFKDKTGVPGVNRNELHKIVLDVAPIEEQKRISQILLVWDKAINACERLIGCKNKTVNHLRRQLVSWEHSPVKPIGSVLKAVSRPQPTPTEAYRALSIRSHGKGTFHRLIDRPEDIGMDTVYAVGPRDLIVNITFAWEGAIALAQPDDEGLFVSHRFPTFEVNENLINRDFLGYAVRSKRFIHSLGVASPGGAGRNRVLSKDDFLQIQIPFPPRSEQDKAAALLKTADQELQLLEAKRDALISQKRGLMQKLLTGQWRVNAAKEAAE